MKKIQILLMVGILSITLMGCQEKREVALNTAEHTLENTENLFENQEMDNNVFVQAQYGRQILSGLDETGNLTNIKDKTVALELEFSNSGSDCEVGSLLFVNGIPQPYRCDGGDDTYIAPVVLKESETKVVSLEFEPITGKKGDQLQVQLMGILQPSFHRTESIPSFGNNHSLAMRGIFSMKGQEDNESPIFYETVRIKELPQSVVASFIREDSNGVETNYLDERLYLSLIQEDNAEKLLNEIVSKDGKIEFQIALYGNLKENYVVSVFLDNEVVNAFGETAYAKVSMTGEQQLYLLDAELESSSIKDFSNLYAIAVPIQNPEKNEIKKTETVSVRIFK